MFNHDSCCSNAARDSRGQSSYDSKTNERASLRRSRFQGRTLTSTWGKSRGWLKGVNFQRRLIHVLAPLTSFRSLFRSHLPSSSCPQPFSFEKTYTVPLYREFFCSLLYRFLFPSLYFCLTIFFDVSLILGYLIVDNWTRVPFFPLYTLARGYRFTFRFSSMLRNRKKCF